MKNIEFNKTSSFIDVAKLNNLDIVKKLNGIFLNFFGLKLSFYHVSNNNISNFCDSAEIYKMICKSKSKSECKKLMSKDIKKAINKKELIVHECSLKIKRLIIPVMVRRKVYGIALSNEIKNGADNGKLQKTKPKQSEFKQGTFSKELQRLIFLNDSELKRLGDFSTSFINYVFMSKFEEVAFFNSDLGQTNLQESISKAMDYIKDNYYRSNLSLNEVSEAVNLSPYYFSHQFRKEYNATFIEYLTKVRLEAAVGLLKDFRLSVAQVSFAVGYQDPNYFSKVFKKWMDISPQEYRDQIIGQRIS